MSEHLAVDRLSTEEIQQQATQAFAESGFVAANPGKRSAVLTRRPHAGDRIIEPGDASDESSTAVTKAPGGLFVDRLNLSGGEAAFESVVTEDPDTGERREEDLTGRLHEDTRVLPHAGFAGVTGITEEDIESGGIDTNEEAPELADEALAKDRGTFLDAAQGDLRDAAEQVVAADSEAGLPPTVAENVEVAGGSSSALGLVAVVIAFIGVLIAWLG